MEKNNQSLYWDVRIGAQECSSDGLCILYRQECRKYCFQLEKGSKNGYEHYQGRICLKARQRKKQVIDMMRIAFPNANGLHVSPTSNANKGNYFYVTKSDTRMDGPWMDTDKLVQEPYDKPVTLRDWQVRLKDLMLKLEEERNDRNIVVFVNPQGKEGKSWFAGYAWNILNWIELHSTCPSAEDIIQMAHGLCEPLGRYIFLVDIPKGTAIKHWFNIAQALEKLKQGRLYDKRYKGSVKPIQKPQIVVFCNQAPPENCMSDDVFIHFKKDITNHD